MFSNQLPERLSSELKAANEANVSPISANDDAFDEVINAGTVKWIVTFDDELWLIPHSVDGRELSHAVINKGEPVLAAGQAEIAGVRGQYIGLLINNHSGHYLPSADSLAIGLRKFAELGIRFDDEGIERV